MILKLYNLITGVNETKHLAQYESCESKCELNESVCNLLQKLNHDECLCDCKEITGLGLLYKRLHMESQYPWLWM